MEKFMEETFPQKSQDIKINEWKPGKYQKTSSLKFSATLYISLFLLQ